MMTKQDSQQEMIYSVKQIRRKRRMRRLLLRACLCFLLAGAVCFSTVKVAAGLLFPSGNGNAARETLSASGEQHASSAEGKSDETSKGYIVLDPGHGGEDSPGCIYGGIQERDITLELSLLIRDELVQQGYTVMMTREEDESVSPEQRAEIANKSGADLFISIHLNAYDDAGVSGIETWFNPNTNPLSSTLAEDVQQSTAAATEAKDRGTYSNTSLIVIREVLMPSCLVEVGYLSNDEEREKMTTEDYQKKIAQGIIDGVGQYFEKYPRS